MLFKGDKPNANNQKSQNASNTDGGTKGNGAESSQVSSKDSQKTTDIGNQETVNSTSELRGGDFAQGKIEAQQRSGECCEYCGAENTTEGDHFIPLNEGKKLVNAGQMTKSEAKQTLNKPDNIVNSCTDCNCGARVKGTNMPSNTPGKGKWVLSKPNEHVKKKVDELDKFKR